MVVGVRGAIAYTFPPEGGREIDFLLPGEGPHAHVFSREQDGAQAGGCCSLPGGVLRSSGGLCVPAAPEGTFPRGREGDRGQERQRGGTFSAPAMRTCEHTHTHTHNLLQTGTALVSQKSDFSEMAFLR